MRKFSGYVCVFLLLALLTPATAFSCCGLYASKQGEKLSGRAAKVVIARDGARMVVTLANDYAGDAKDFAIILPVPAVLTREQIHVTDNALLDALDAYSAPRLIETVEKNPCPAASAAVNALPAEDGGANAQTKMHGIQIAAHYLAGDYDVVILSAEESAGLLKYLSNAGYAVPARAQKVLQSYIQQKMFFLIAKVRLQEGAGKSFGTLRPLQLAYNTADFTLPIRLGMLNAPEANHSMPIAGYMKDALARNKPAGPVDPPLASGGTEASRNNKVAEASRKDEDGMQDLLLFILSRNGRVEPANYRMLMMRTDRPLPLFIADDFGGFYETLFTKRARAESDALFLEYAGDAQNCAPCASAPLEDTQLKSLGALWLSEPTSAAGPVDATTARLEAMQRGIPGAAHNPNNLIAHTLLPSSAAAGPFGRGRTGQESGMGAQLDNNAASSARVFLTRLHARYNPQTFPEDIRLKNTGNSETVIAQFTVRHAWEKDGGKGGQNVGSCEVMAQDYLKSLPTRYRLQAETLARMTGWDIRGIVEKMAKSGQTPDGAAMPADDSPWWKDMWKN